MNCQVVGKLFSVMKTMSDTEKTPSECASGQPVYTAEINFLKSIAHANEINAVELSNQMNVTRSAVTQMSNKLEERNLIEKYSKPDNKKEKYLRLTELGENVLKEYEQKHRDANERMCDYLSSLDANQRKTLIDFLDNLEQCMPISNFECMKKRELTTK